MRLALFALALSAAAPSWAASGGSHKEEFSPACDYPPCTREELQHYEKQLIKRTQRANSMSAEARFRGEVDSADRLHRVFQRNFDRRRVVSQKIEELTTEN